MLGSCSFAPAARWFQSPTLRLVSTQRRATSGSNFEVLIGFEVTPQMAAFNREGKRFRLNVGQASNTPNP